MVVDPLERHSYVTFPKGPPKGAPASCHPDKPSVAKTLCNACYLRSRRGPGWKPKAPDAIDYVQIAALADIPQDKGLKVVQAVLATMKAALLRGERVSIPGFGTFRLSRWKARVVGNPIYGGTMNLPARTTVKFKPSLPLVYLVNPQWFTPHDSV